MTIRFDHPEYLWLLLLAAPIILLGMRSLAALDPPRRWTAIGLRLGVLAALVLMLAGLQTVQTHDDLTVIAVVDQSESVRRFAKPPPAEGEAEDDTNTDYQQWALSFLKEAASDRRGGDKLGLVTYDGKSTVRALPSEAAELDSGTIDQPTEGTDTASAIRSAIALYTPDAGQRMVLVSDGNDTTGDIIAAANEAAAQKIPIDILPVPYQVRDEVMVERLYAPSEAREGQTVALRVVLRATKPAAGMIQLLHDDQPIDLNGEKPGRGAPVARADWTLEEQDAPAPDSDPDTITQADARGRYVTVREVDIPLGFTGINNFQVVFEPAEGSDSMQVNNKAEAFTLVSGKGRILFVDNIGGTSGNILPRALASRGIEMDVVNPGGVPFGIGKMQRYDAIILQNVPYDAITPPQQRMLVKYVHDLGGGLVMLGGPDSFGAGGWTNSELDRYILPVSCQIPSQTILPSGALVLVIDRSSSMGAPVGGSGRSQQELANEAAVLALNTLYPQDLVGVVAFSGDADMVVDVQMNANPKAVASTVRKLQPQGGTNIYAGLNTAYEALAPLSVQDAAVKHIILLTDGQSMEPEPGGYMKLARKMRQNGITLSTIGVGDGHDQTLLTQLAQMGKGNYHPIVNPSNLPQVFIKEAKTIRKNLVKEVPFTPTVRPTGSPIMAGLNDVPTLNGFVLTGEKSDPRVVMPMVGPEGEPVFAHWQVGLGRSAAFTSDATNRWATPWLNWGGYPDFWASTVRRIARPSATRDADMLVAIRDGRVHVQLDAAAENDPTQSQGRSRAGAFGNFLDVKGSVLKPDGTTEPITLQQVGPGQYRADTPADQTGNYVVSLFIDSPDGTRRTVFGGAGKPPGEELRRFKSNNALLERIAQITNGRILDPIAAAPTNLFNRDQVFETRSVRPLWRTLLAWLIVLFLLDVACRRIAWDAAATLAWTRERVGMMLGTLRPREAEAGATLAALKSRRNQAEADASETRKAQPPADPLAPAPSSKRKFEAAKDFQAQDNFTQAVGGAGDSDPASPKSTDKTDPDTAVKDQGPTTSRLLAAKRRAREDRGK